MKLKKYNEFVNESMYLDPDFLEQEILAFKEKNNDELPDCLDLNIRDWTTILNQYDTIGLLKRKAYKMQFTSDEILKAAKVADAKYELEMFKSLTALKKSWDKGATDYSPFSIRSGVNTYIKSIVRDMILQDKPYKKSILELIADIHDNAWSSQEIKHLLRNGGLYLNVLKDDIDFINTKATDCFLKN